jgi:hypothetical protein
MRTSVTPSHEELHNTNIHPAPRLATTAALLLLACAQTPAAPTLPPWPEDAPLAPDACPPNTTLSLEPLQHTCLDPQQQPHGPFRLYNPQGHLTRAGAWLHGKPFGRWRFWNEHNRLRAEDHFDEQGRLHGPSRRWSDDHTLLADLLYREGRPWEGFTSSPGEDGALLQHRYRDGKRLP